VDWLITPELWASLLTLTAIEIVLGIDNLVFVAILVGRLPAQRQRSAWRIGLLLAMITRLALLAIITEIMRLTAPVFSLFDVEFSWRDLILIGGGLFLVYKGTREIHHRIEGDAPAENGTSRVAGYGSVLAQIVALDLVFSLDSVITAVGMANEIAIMMLAVVIAVITMMAAAAPVSGFIERHPTVKMLALSFLLLIGMTLVADGFGAHVPKGYIYAAIGFSVLVETLNQVAARARRPRTGGGVS
jgi:predicted tellurium resistance membrane protein TerC